MITSTTPVQRAAPCLANSWWTKFVTSLAIPSQFMRPARARSIPPCSPVLYAEKASAGLPCPPRLMAMDTPLASTMASSFATPQVLAAPTRMPAVVRNMKESCGRLPAFADVGTNRDPKTAEMREARTLGLLLDVKPLTLPRMRANLSRRRERRSPAQPGRILNLMTNRDPQPAIPDPAAGRVTTVRWLRHGQPVPEGWRLADQRLDTHHNAHAVLIVEDPHTGEHR